MLHKWSFIAVLVILGGSWYFGGWAGLGIAFAGVAAGCCFGCLSAYQFLATHPNYLRKLTIAAAMQRAFR